MTLLYPYVLFFLLPLYLLYKQSNTYEDKYKQRQNRLLYLTLFFILIALSRPAMQNSLQEQKIDAKDYIIALDASFSMQATDLSPTRYEVAKENIKKIITTLKKDRFSIFAFTTNTMLISPPTTDTTISMQALEALAPQYILTKGTSLLRLFQTLSKSSYRSKDVLIFTDGGEDKDLAALVSLCKQNTIIPYIIATASSSGATLKKENKLILDDKKNLVISRENPILKTLADECNGEYYQLHSNKDISKKVIADLEDKKESTGINTKVVSYKELYFIPLVFALVTFFLSVTKLHQLYIFILFLFVPHPSEAAMLFDFYTKSQAKAAYEQKNYLHSAQEYTKISPCVASYYNAGVTYYKAKAYKKAMLYFSQIKTPDRALKQKVFYNMGNVAVQLKHYTLALSYYQRALILGDDKDALFNLALLYKLSLKEKKDLSKMLPHKEKKKKSKKEREKQKNKESKQSKKSSSTANQKASQKSSGSGSNTKKKEKKQENLQRTKKKTKSQYKLGYKAYELINKGYTNEIHPW